MRRKSKIGGISLQLYKEEEKESISPSDNKALRNQLILIVK